MLAGKGDLLPVSAFPVDGTWPVATAKWEKRNLALEIPVWDPKICIQCNQCALVCPHAAIRAKVYDESALAGAPATFKSTAYKGNEYKGKHFTIQVAPEDCTGCNLCVNVCPAKDRTNPKHKAIDMHPQAPLRDAERANYDFFLDLPEMDRTDDRAARPQELAVPRAAVRVLGRLRRLRRDAVPQAAHAALRRPPADRQRHRLLVDLRRQPADHAVHDEPRRPRPGLVELALRGQRRVRLRLPARARRARRRRARPASQQLAPQIGDGLADGAARRRSVERGRHRGAARAGRRAAAAARRARRSAEARRLETLADYLVKKSVWLVGGDGWAYDIGYGGLDHVLANRRDVNVLVLDTEVYSNTGGQQSKATPLGAAAKFAAAGQAGRQEGSRPARQHVRARLRRAGRLRRQDGADGAGVPRSRGLPGPSLIIAYSHCIAHGYDMAQGAAQQKLAVDSGVWPLYRFDPRRLVKGEPPLHLDYGPPKAKVADYMRNESRFRMVERADPARYKTFVAESQAAAERRYAVYQQLAGITVPVIQATRRGAGARLTPKEK